MHFLKAHGLGNDYLVLESALPLEPEFVKAICDRHRGVGSDGILAPAPPNLGADYGVRIWNPDGSIAEKSGNGLRIFAVWLRRERGAATRFSISTGACKVECRESEQGMSVEMGRPSFAPADVPIAAASELIEQPISLNQGSLRATAVGMGNPHCVIFRTEPLDQLPWRSWGAQLERHTLFPNRTNVQIARVVSPEEVEIRIFERGAGETQASGSSACAVVAAGVKTGRLAAARVRVLMPGGVLWVTVTADGLLLEGPVEIVGRFQLDEEWLRTRVR